MKTEIIRLDGDVPNTSIDLRILKFAGSDAQAPKAYLQSSLHGAELPGQAALHFLIPMLKKAAEENRILGDITLVPQANPVASDQWSTHQHMGRFDAFSKVNFNRDFPLLNNFDTSSLPAIDAPISLVRRLKAQLLRLALPHDIVLDLHCDDESESYLYSANLFAEGIQDLAVALGSTAILTWNDEVAGAPPFEDACAHPVLKMKRSELDLKRRLVTTIEFRGLTDVYAESGKSDAEGLYKFLVHRGTVSDEGVKLEGSYKGLVTPFDNVEIVRAPVGGMIFYHTEPGDVVAKDAKLVTIVSVPGEPEHDVVVTAPQPGRVLTRRSVRYIRRGDDLVKLLADKPSQIIKKPGSLEA